MQRYQSSGQAAPHIDTTSLPEAATGGPERNVRAQGRGPDLNHGRLFLDHITGPFHRSDCSRGDALCFYCQGERSTDVSNACAF